MKFHDYAANEATLMANRLLTRRSKKSLADLQALRKTLDQAVQSFETTIGAWAKVEQDEEIPEVAERLTAAAAAHADALVKSAKSEADAATKKAKADADALVKAANSEADALIKAAQAEADALVQKITQDADARIAQVRADLDKRAKEHAALADELKAARKDVDKRQADVAQARAETEAARKEIDRIRAAAEKAQSEIAGHKEQLNALKQQLKATSEERATLQEAHKITEAALRDAIAAKSHEIRAKAALEHELGGLRAALARLSAVCNELDACTAIPNVVTTVAAALGADFPRVALFSVRANRFEGVYQSGFDFETDISKLVVPPTMNPLMAKAAASGHVETIDAATGGAGNAPFGGSPTFTLAMPLAVHGDVLWVVYVDNAGAGADKNAVPPAQRTAFAELLRRQALPLLEKLSLAPKVASELRAYANTLIEQIESMYAADSEAGEAPARVVERLDDNLRCARDMFARRVDGESPAAERLFDERLTAMLRERSTTPFGRDLNSVLSREGDAAVRAS